LNRKRKGPPRKKGSGSNGKRGVSRRPGQQTRAGKAKKALDWNPAIDSRYVDPGLKEQETMSIEERKAAQLAKWKKELGLDD
jgi:hypothetical protein